MIKLTSKGDNNWTKKFETAERAYWFLYGLLSKKEIGKSGLVFDCEDDMITWEEDGKKKYCAGWHWEEFGDEKQITMPDGNTLYHLMRKVEDE